MPYRYAPMLKTKAGEAVALENLTPAVKARTFPILHITTKLSPSFQKRLGPAWSGLPLAVDGKFNFSQHGTPVAFTSLIQALRSSGVLAMPAVTWGDPVGYYQAAIAEAALHGMVIKTNLTDLPATMAWLSSPGWNPAFIDLVVDIGHVPGLNPALIGGMVQLQVTAHQSMLSTFRSRTLVGASAPKDHGPLAYGLNSVPRNEWLVWSAIHASLPVRFDYGDYGTGHPDLTEPPGAAMSKATVSARYTLAGDWVIIKGRSISGPYGLPMSQQYHAHAQMLSTHPQFGGVLGCWADGRIQQIAAGGGANSGSRQSWSEIAVNRHISKIVDMLP
ncbi:hypothetical protein [uncultured Sphingomonas sp.]|uniref:beta family protein n=1 Tax=uncultured Sphingomonas sp. TaxID=158754 RepID=UPI0025F7521C|nr:hypothetical protein [uncultured Sphingomonas sp.]